MDHYSFVNVVDRLLDSNWGRNFDNSKEAEKFLVDNPQNLAAWAFMRMLLGMRESFGRRYREEPDALKRGEDDLSVPGVKIGDLLYECEEIAEGVDTYVVIGTDGDFPIVVRSGVKKGCDSRLWSYFATKDMFGTVAEALKKGAESDLKCHGRRADAAKEVLKAIESGEDLSRFLEGVDADDDEE